jgi:predicted AAA+ superfamily ATPase
MVAMKRRARIYDAILGEHISGHRQMALVSGPRQVGKTTLCRGLASVYLDWDNDNHRDIILKGPQAVAEYAGLEKASARPVVAAFDELHKYGRWKQFLKGLFDTYEQRVRVIVTGSSRLETYRRGGDSLMGRYFPFRMHPFSVAELVRAEASAKLIRPPSAIGDSDWQALLAHGGYPEPFLKRSGRFSNRWQSLRLAQLFKEDLRDLTRIQELGQMEMLGRLLVERSGDQLVYAALARQVRVSENTVRKWVDTLCALHYGFLVRPWHRNVTRALRKEPKWYLRDWSRLEDPGKRAETLCACHLLKAVEGWTDLGLGEFELRYVRDRERREVDFIVIRDERPWLLIETKSAETKLAPSLEHFQRETGAAHAFQVVIDEEYVDADCFSYRRPVVVPARTLLSQLL